MIFRSRLIPAVVIWSGAMIIVAALAVMQELFGCVFFQRGEPDRVAAPFGLDRFAEGRMIDESVAAAVAH